MMFFQFTKCKEDGEIMLYGLDLRCNAPGLSFSA
jgi:hypothetical protein